MPQYDWCPSTGEQCYRTSCKGCDIVEEICGDIDCICCTDNKTCPDYNNHQK